MKKFLVLILGLHLFLLTQLQFTAWPEMLSYPYLFNNGFSLYKDFIHPYPPLLTLVLAGVFEIFGYKLVILKIFTWVLILSTDVLVYLLGGVWAVVFFVLTQPFLDGNMLWFDLAVVAPVLLGFLLMQGVAPCRKRVVQAGLFLSLAALIKQTAGIFVVAPLFSNKVRNLDYFKPIFIIGAIFAIWLTINNTFSEFFNWAFVYPITQWSKFPGYVEMSITNKQLLILILFTLPVIYYWKKTKEFLLPLFYVASLISIYPRFSFFHFQLGIALSAVAAGRVLRKYVVVLVITMLLIIVPVIQIAEARFYGKTDIKLAEKIAENTQGEVYLQGLHSGLYALGGFLPAKPWFDNFGWYLEIPGVQEEILKRWDKDPPEYVVTKYLIETRLGSYRPRLITDWISTRYTNTKSLEEEVGIWKRND